MLLQKLLAKKKLSSIAFFGICILLICTFFSLFSKQTTSATSSNTVSGLVVSVGYAEDKETNNPNPASFPIPWLGAPNTIFLGNPITGTTNCGSLPSCYDGGAIRLDNTTSSDVTVSNVVVDDHSSLSGGKIFSLWGSFTVPAGKSVILTQNPPGNDPSFINFDTSSFPANTNCSNPITVAPTVTLTINGVSTILTDSTHVLDTGGVDLGSCTSGGQNESYQWRLIGNAGVRTATLALTPTTSTLSPGQSVTQTATLVDGSNQPVPNVTVGFVVINGPDVGLTGSSVTNASGLATFSYTSTVTGIDTLVATVTTVGTFSSNTATVTWSNGGTPTPTPQPAQLSNLQVFDSTNAASWSLQTNLQTGLIQYGDRSYTFSNIPTALIGSAWIKTANASRAYNGNPTVTFTANQRAAVYVAMDTRIPQPSWIDASWINTGMTLSNSEASGHNTFSLFLKVFPAGPISLGPNNNGVTSDNMYSVIVIPAPATPVSPTPTPTAQPSYTPSPTPSSSPTPSQTPTPLPTGRLVQLSNLEVLDTTNASFWSLQTNIQSGEVQYGDRSYTFVSIPSMLLGTAWIRTANASRAYGGNPTVTFTINQQAMVYVVVDTRIPQPSWMDPLWTNTGLTLTDNQTVGHNTFTLFAKTFPAGTVSLGPNDNGINNYNMYTVIVE